MKNVLIVGMGEVGRPIYEIIEATKKFNVYGIDIDPMKCSLNEPDVHGLPIHCMHVCIPCKDMKSFIKAVKSYYEEFNPYMIIIHSTVAPTTTNFVADVLQSNCIIAHSPQFGTHFTVEKMKEQFLYYPKMIGPVVKSQGLEIAQYFNDLGFNVIIYNSPLETEMIKVMETTYAGWMITFFNEFHRMATYYGASFPQVVDGLINTYEPNKNKPIWFPSVIEGHCIMQNIDLLLQNYQAGFLELIKNSNELRKEELMDKKIMIDVENIKTLRERFYKKGGYVR